MFRSETAVLSLSDSWASRENVSARPIICILWEDMAARAVQSQACKIFCVLERGMKVILAYSLNVAIDAVLIKYSSREKSAFQLLQSKCRLH